MANYTTKSAITSPIIMTAHKNPIMGIMKSEADSSGALEVSSILGFSFDKEVPVYRRRLLLIMVVAISGIIITKLYKIVV